MVTHAQASSWLDYCNVLYMGLPVKMIQKLKLVQNAVASIYCEATLDSIMPFLYCRTCMSSQLFSRSNSKC